MAYYIVEFILVSILSYIFYYKVFMKRNHKKNVKPIEFSYLEARYQLKLEKINRNKLSKLVSLCNALIIATTVVAIDFVDNILLQMLIGFGLLMALIVIVYYFIGLYYKKKGLTKRCMIIQK